MHNYLWMLNTLKVTTYYLYKHKILQINKSEKYQIITLTSAENMFWCAKSIHWQSSIFHWGLSTSQHSAPFVHPLCLLNSATTPLSHAQLQNQEDLAERGIFKQPLKSKSAYIRDPQIWLMKLTFLQSLAPTLIKLTHLWFSNDPEDTD